MRSWWMVAALAFAASPPLLAQQPAKALDPADDSVGAVQNDFSATVRNHSANAPKDLPPGVNPPLLAESELQGFLERCWKIYDVSAGEPAEFDALAQVLQLAANPYLIPASEKSIQAWRDASSKLFADFLDDDRMAQFAAGLRAPEKLQKEANALSAKLAQSKSVAVKAALAHQPLAQRADAASNKPLDEAGEKQLLADLDAFAAQYGAIASLRGGTYADWVKSTSYALVNLKIGGVAPDIEGPDLDGVKFKLTDYRGKVVLLDFWGYW